MRQRRASFNSQSFQPFSNIPKAEQQDLSTLFKKSDLRDGGISFYDFIQIIKTTLQLSQPRKNQILKDISTKGIRILDFNFLLSTVSTLKKQRQLHSQSKLPNSQFFDTFVALGGNLDGSGYITRSNLINTMKNQFGLEVDLDALDMKNIMQEKLNFDEFCEIFENPENVIIQIVQSLMRSDSTKSIVINEEEFRNYLAKLPQ